MDTLNYSAGEYLPFSVLIAEIDADYATKFGSLDSYEKGSVHVINDNVKNYAFSNCFEIASKSNPTKKCIRH
jgi:hypothetical protein